MKPVFESFVGIPLLLLVLSLEASARTGGPDRYGYTFKDSTESNGPGFHWIDISDTGRLVIDGGQDVSSNDSTHGIGGPVALEAPFMFYGKVLEKLVPTTNGYLSDETSETGSDNSNDCGLPQQATPAANGARIYAYNDALTAGKVYYQYFLDSPHPHRAGGVSVFQWDNFSDAQGDMPTLRFDFQVLLFANGDIILQYERIKANFGNGASATIGIQDYLATGGVTTVNSGLQYVCNDPSAISDDLAILFEPPELIVTTELDEFDYPDYENGAGLSLREAMMKAALDPHPGVKIVFSQWLDGEVIHLQDEAVVTIGTLQLTQQALQVLTPLSIDASSLSSGITVDAGGYHRVLEVTDYDHMDGVTIRGGDANGGDGGGLWLFNSAALVWEDENGSVAGAVDPLESILEFVAGLLVPNPRELGETPTCVDTVHAGQGHLSLARCAFEGNLATEGGGIYVSSLEFLETGDCGQSQVDIPLSAPRSGIVPIVHLSQCSLSGNEAERGGGIYSRLAQVRCSQTQFTGNTASDGGGLYRDTTWDDSPDYFFDGTQCTFAGNEAERGGAVYAEGISLVQSGLTLNSANTGGGFYGYGSIVDSSISMNTAANSGGGVYAFDDLDLTNSTIALNGASSGGGLHINNEGATISVVNSTISGNEAVTGGAIQLINGTLEISSSTICNNSGLGGLYAEAGQMNMTLSILANNTTSWGDLSNWELDGSANFTSGGFNLTDSIGTNLSPFQPLIDLENTDPMLGPLGYYGGTGMTHLPDQGSPAIDFVAASLASQVPDLLLLDQRGLPRPVDGNEDGTSGFDLGAVEHQGALVVTTAVDEIAEPGTGLSLREALQQSWPGSHIVFDSSLDGEVIQLAASAGGQGTPLTQWDDGSIDASDLAEGITVSGGDETSVFIVASGVSTTLTNVNIADGYSDFPGAGINNSGDLTMVDCRVTGCRSEKGGGVFTDFGSSLVMNACVIENNGCFVRCA